MKKENLIKELKDMSALDFATRLKNSTGTNKQKQELCKLWYSLNRKNSKSSTTKTSDSI